MTLAPLAEFDVASLEAALHTLGFPRSHAQRLLREFYDAHGSPTIDELRFGKKLTRLLHERPMMALSRVITRHVSSDGTIKLLVAFASGGAVESVLMPTWRDGVAAGCVSSQIGCAMGCDFCASTRGGFERNLSAGEIVEQFLHLSQAAAWSGRRMRTLVFMGMGEPLLNLDNVIAAIERIAHPRLGQFGWRQITVSTVGIVPAIDELASANVGVHLALSLHAADDETRSKIVPMNRRYPIGEVMEATKRYSDRTGRVANIEYCLIADVNDSNEQAEKLATLMDGFRAHVNIIPYNPIGLSLSGVLYRRPSPDRMERFITILRERGVVAHVRVPRGDDVAAACGQLRERLAVVS